MMPAFEINFNWLQKDIGEPASRATFAEIAIAVRGESATELLDHNTYTIRNGVRASAYTLALWLAQSWWRLRWEPERSSDSWSMSHRVGAAGEGYLWPDLTFISDGRTIQVQSRATPQGSPQPIRYLNNFDHLIPAIAFERTIDGFIDAVIGRLKDLHVEEETLSKLWNDVQEECRDSELSLYRRLEAILGFDPDEAPEQELRALIEAMNTFGIRAVEELAAESELNAQRDLRILWNGARQNATILRIPHCDSLRTQISRVLSEIPWRAADQAALMAREAWSMPNAPFTNEDIAKLFGINPDFINKAEDHKQSAPINAGYRNGEPDVIAAALVSPYPENRRFALLRLVGDHLTAPEEDRLLPACLTSRTYRQKFQRAFAQEVLCPYEDLMNRLGAAEPTDEAIEDVAHHFLVSPIMIQSILVNRRNVDRERFFDETGRPLFPDNIR
ncbi:MAG: hypothetical protein AB1641_06555 [Thermodesulfobacteriota bacterium]